MIIEIDFEPTAKGRPRISRSGHAFTPAKTRTAESTLQVLLRHALKGKGWNGATRDAIMLSIVFCSTRPKKPVNWYPSRSDLDNYAKLVLDACNGILWYDDRQIICLNLMKSYASTGKIIIEIETVATPEDLPNGAFPKSIHQPTLNQP